MTLQLCPLPIYEISLTCLPKTAAIYLRFSLSVFCISSLIQFPHFPGLPFWCGGATDVGEKGS